MQWLLERFISAENKIAFIHRDRKVSYSQVVNNISDDLILIKKFGILGGERIVVIGDYSPELFCMLLALAYNNCVIIPLATNTVMEHDSAIAISGCEWVIDFRYNYIYGSISKYKVDRSNTLLSNFLELKKPGIILFSSGSTGLPKAILHDFEMICQKFYKKRKGHTAIPFLMVDHFGGINTILGITANLGTVVTIQNRSVQDVCAAIERYQVELLPTTPSFLTLFLAANLGSRYDLSSISRVTYGTEVMPQNTLDRIKRYFPNAIFQQTYGLSEVGVLSSESRTDGSLWVRLGGEGFETKVLNGILWVRSKYSMVGYLNAPSEFDSDGWFNTKDQVEVDGEYFKIVGRTTDIINVAGQKVYPSEVENEILAMDNVSDVAVYGEPHPLLGQIVVAKIVTLLPEGLEPLKRRVRRACLDKMAQYKAPMKIIISDSPLHNLRQKKIRN